MSLPPDWPRPQFQPGGARPLLFYWVPGAFAHLDLPLSSALYRVGPPSPERELFLARKADDPAAFAAALDGAFGRSLEESPQPGFADAVRAAPEYAVLRWELEDAPNLNHLRDAVGLVAWLLDHGGVGVLDWQTLRWWTKEAWLRELFAPAGPVPRRHADVLVSEGGSPGTGRWYHTRGMRKFGRPDLSVHDVPPEHEEAVVDLCNRFIEFQALGAVLPEGEPVRVRGLPEGMTCHHAGHPEDPDFNNTHVEIRWPR